MGRRSWCGEENADKISKPAVQPACGAIAQLGERIVRNDEVVGSIPTSSTIFSHTCGVCLIGYCTSLATKSGLAWGLPQPTHVLNILHLIGGPAAVARIEHQFF